MDSAIFPDSNPPYVITTETAVWHRAFWHILTTFCCENKAGKVTADNKYEEFHSIGEVRRGLGGLE